MFKKKNKVSSLVVVLSLMLAVSGCGDDSTSSQTAFNQMFEKRGTIHGAVFDAVTNKRIGNAADGSSVLKVELAQGAERRSPDLLIANETDTLSGQYAFSNVPVSLDAGNTQWTIVVTKPGYQRVEGLVMINANSGALAGTTDTTYSKLQNIYLYPEGVTAPDIKVVVEFGGEAVVGATVLLTQRPFQNVPTSDTSDVGAGGVAGTRLIPLPGTTEGLQQKTVLVASGAAGADNAVATFPGSSLVLGGQYAVTVLPTVYDDNGTKVQLAKTVGANITVGTTVPYNVVQMTDLAPGNDIDGLHVVFASNRDTDKISGIVNPGELTLVFNRDVELLSADNTIVPFGAILTNPGLSTLNINPVTATISATDARILILKPKFTAGPLASEKNMFVTFSGGAVRIKGDNEVSAVFGALQFLDGSAVNGVVNITGP